MKTTYLYTLLLLVAFFVASCVGVGQEGAATAESSGEKKQAKKLPEEEKGVVDSIPSKELVSSSKLNDSLYPKEFYDSWGKEAYIKMWKGIYVYLENLSGQDYDLVVSRIDFFDALGHKINVFDVLANNPYTQKTVPDLEDENYQAYTARNFVPKDVTESKAGYTPEKYYSYIQIPSHQSMPVVGYHLLGGMDDGITDWKFTAICLDEKGNILRKFENLDIDPYEFCLSENKKFFCVSYGGLRGENLTRLRNNGFRIYEVETGKLVYEMEVDGEHAIYGPSISDITLITISVTGNDFSSDLENTYLIVDAKSRTIFKKTFSYDEQRMIKGADATGFIMRNPKTQKQSKLLYEENFAIEKF